MPTITTFKYLSINELCALLNLGRSSITRLRATGGFPKPIYLTKQSPRWRSDEVEAWIDALTEGETS